MGYLKWGWMGETSKGKVKRHIGMGESMVCKNILIFFFIPLLVIVDPLLVK